MGKSTTEAPQGTGTPASRRLFTRAEAATLVGMALVVSSLFLTWQRFTTGSVSALAGAALYRDKMQTEVYRTGFGMQVWLPLTLCAVAAGATLLWDSTPKTRMALLAVQSACGLACVVIPLTRFALLSGVLVALIGGALLIFGAIDRYSIGV